MKTTGQLESDEVARIAWHKFQKKQRPRIKGLAPKKVYQYKSKFNKDENAEN